MHATPLETDADEEPLTLPDSGRQAGPGAERETRRGSLRGLRVVLVVNSVEMGGVEEHVRQVATGLVARAAQVTVVVPSGKDVPAAGVQLTVAPAQLSVTRGGA